MWIYYLLILFLFYLGLEGRRKSKVSLQLFNIGIIILILFVGLRDEVGCDYLAYKSQFETLIPFDHGHRIDKYYYNLISILKYWNLTYESLNIITSIIFFLGFRSFALRFGNPAGILAFSFPFLIFAIPMAATRQALAMGFILFGLDFILRRKLIIAFITIFVASQFHSSAILFALFIPLIYQRDLKKSILMALPFLGVFAMVVMNSTAFELAMYRYAEGGVGRDAAGAVYRTFILFLFGGYFQLFMRKRWKTIMPKSFPLINVASLSMIAMFGLAFILPTIADRLGYYLFIFSSVMASQVPTLLNKNSDYIYLGMIGLNCFIFLVWSILSTDVQTCYSPYSSWIFGA